jgi:DNA-binding NarL/FixJ family response regulator
MPLNQGKAVEDIAELLGIGLKTVANHQTNIRQKLDIHSPVELIRLAIKHGVIMKV